MLPERYFPHLTTNMIKLNLTVIINVFLLLLNTFFQHRYVLFLENDFKMDIELNKDEITVSAYVPYNERKLRSFDAIVWFDYHFYFIIKF